MLRSSLLMSVLVVVVAGCGSGYDEQIVRPGDVWEDLIRENCPTISQIEIDEITLRYLVLWSEGFTLEQATEIAISQCWGDCGMDELCGEVCARCVGAITVAVWRGLGPPPKAKETR